ncbi:MAG: GHKL domain-containing protein [Oscillospiraceae bacterium]|nr:GHKL domain-containing protein [Oscillospiraceae bacterium]
MEFVYRPLYVMIVSAVCFTSSIKTAGIYFAKARYTMPKTAAFFAVFCVLLLLDTGNYLISSLLRQAALIGFMFVLFKGKKREKLGMLTVFTAVLEFAWNGIDEMLGACVIHWQGSDVILYITGGISWIAAALIACILFSKTKISEGAFLKGSRMLFISSGLLMILTDICVYGITKGVVMVSHGSENTFYDQIFTHMEVVILSLLCMTICVVLMFGLNKLFGYDLSEDILKKEIGYYRSMAEQFRDQVNVRHDMKNHLISLSALADRNEWEKLSDYLSKLCTEGLIENNAIDTGNSIINAFMNIKRQTAAHKSIKFSCDMNIKQPLAADEYDLCVIFGNILDNAIKAAEEAKDEQFVSVRTEAVKNYLVINVKNSAAELPERFDVQNYGTGLMNVRKTVEKGKGIMEIRTTGGCFEISILLPLAR